MTEAEWLACEDPQQMLEYLGRRASDRKLRLFAVGCCLRYAADLAIDDDWGLVVEVAERFADGMATAAELYTAGCYNSDEDPALEAAALPNPEIPFTIHAVRAAYLTCSSRADPRGNQPRTPQFWDKVTSERRSISLLARDIFGNPFRPVSFDPEWRTSTAIAIAQGMYESRDFGAMPILADALQDAGCENDDVLNHCRGTGPHVRGCWVVDLVLGKS